MHTTFSRYYSMFTCLYEDKCTNRRPPPFMLVFTLVLAHTSVIEVQIHPKSSSGKTGLKPLLQ